MRMLQGPLGALLILGVLVWLGMGVSVATLLRRAEVPAVRAYVTSLLIWPLVLRRLRQLPRPWTDDAIASADPTHATEEQAGDGTGDRAPDDHDPDDRGGPRPPGDGRADD